MKFELEDERIASIIGQQLSAAVAKVTDAEIRKRVDEVLAVKFERITDARVAEIVASAAVSLVGSHLGTSTYTRHAAVLKYVQEAAMKVFNDAIQHKGN